MSRKPPGPDPGEQKATERPWPGQPAGPAGRMWRRALLLAVIASALALITRSERSGAFFTDRDVVRNNSITMSEEFPSTATPGPEGELTTTKQSLTGEQSDDAAPTPTPATTEESPVATPTATPADRPTSTATPTDALPEPTHTPTVGSTIVAPTATPAPADTPMTTATPLPPEPTAAGAIEPTTTPGDTSDAKEKGNSTDALPNKVLKLFR